VLVEARRPFQFLTAILKVVPELRYSFEHLGGQHYGREKTVSPKEAEEKKFATVPWEPTAE